MSPTSRASSPLPLPNGRAEQLHSFPQQNHESAQIVKQGSLERKTRLMKNYGDIYLVLTAGGFLHAYDKDPTTVSRADDPHAVAKPTLSLFLPNSTLGPPASASSSKHKFYISSIKSATEKQSKFKIGGKKGASLFLFVFTR